MRSILFVLTLALVSCQKPVPPPVELTQEKVEESQSEPAKVQGDKPKPAEESPYAIPVPGKVGFVKSPYAKDNGYIDVRGMPKDTKVKDAYTQKIFLVP